MAVKRKATPPLDHPTLESQQAALDRVVACVTVESVTRLCDQVRVLPSFAVQCRERYRSCSV